MPDEETKAPQEPAPEPEGPAEPSGEPLAEAEPEPAPRSRRPRPGWLCTALHGKMSRVDYFSAPEEHGFPHGCKVILRTDRGTEMGAIVASPRRADLAELPHRPGEVLRAAGGEDLERQRQIEESIEPNELAECAEEVAGHKLPMKLAAAEHLFGGEKIVFYFTADGRVDFRRLVREMAGRYRTRIEFRQIGVRDEARLLAEYEHCGQPLCCRQFLRGLEPVTMRMAKVQKATLDPAKISGRCGRLMCCLRYEEEVYRHLRSKLPPRGVYVLTEEIAGQVISGDIISQKVNVRTERKQVTVEVKDIKQVSREPLAAPQPKVPAEPLRKAEPASPSPSPAAASRKRPRRKPAREQKSEAKGAAEGPAKAGGGGRRGGRRPGRSRRRGGRRGRRGGPAKGGKDGGQAPGGPQKA